MPEPNRFPFGVCCPHNCATHSEMRQLRAVFEQLVRGLDLRCTYPESLVFVESLSPFEVPHGELSSQFMSARRR
jgi:hypothetical protein